MESGDFKIFDDTITGFGCRLIPSDESQAEFVVALRNKPENRRWFINQSILSQATHLAWLANARAKGNDFNWIIELSDGEPVGTISLYNIDWSAGAAELGRLLIAEPWRGRGVAFSASRLVIDRAASAGITRIDLVVKPSNCSAIRLYKRLGFIVADTDEEIITMVKMTPSA
ncbi:GNAT family N-acetyltransferase [Methylobacterium sp. J-030]|uniref:GNAT family N-acetyltransferase n=1 Tax=Methylobacterium sp. J-030 TaxID=2836627 RepID=UPI001FBA56E6|nr:GNAT family N-acetyltransferase [Methylobacterium sp. J-030]MCJ2073097.1 GNAT family N-acetyltransferase [Methylobacterium sp. J-030]